MTDQEIEEILLRIEKAFKEIVEQRENYEINTVSRTDDVTYNCEPTRNKS